MNSWKSIKLLHAVIIDFVKMFKIKAWGAFIRHLLKLSFVWYLHDEVICIVWPNDI